MLLSKPFFLWAVAQKGFVCVFLVSSCDQLGFIYYLLAGSYSLHREQFDFGFYFLGTWILWKEKDWRYLSQLWTQIQQIYIIELPFVLGQRSFIGRWCDLLRIIHRNLHPNPLLRFWAF